MRGGRGIARVAEARACYELSVFRPSPVVTFAGDQGVDAQWDGINRARGRSGSKKKNKSTHHRVFDPAVVSVSLAIPNAARRQPTTTMDYSLRRCDGKSNRLLVVSDRAPEFTAAVKNTLPGVFVVRYNYDTSSLDDIVCTYTVCRVPNSPPPTTILTVTRPDKSHGLRIQNFRFCAL